MSVTQAEIDQLGQLTRAQLRSLSQDFMQPVAVQDAARQLLSSLAQQRLRIAVANFANATATFTEITQSLLEITRFARLEPHGDGVAVLNPILRRFGEVYTAVADVPDDRMPHATPGPGGEASTADSEDVTSDVGMSPATNRVNRSTTLPNIAAEYQQMFDDATIDVAKTELVDRQCQRLVGFQSNYHEVGTLLSIPWYFIGLIHALESNFNFGSHLHNGDSLMHRTVHVPKGRPTADVADPPFQWTTSAADALRGEGLSGQNDWSLPALLYRLEQYNGFGYRKRGLASPYLWSYSDRYKQGKYVSDGVFDPNVVSRQCGAAVLLKRLIQRGSIESPS